MALQDPDPPLWTDDMSDGCTWVPDWLPFVGSMVDCCREHDRAYHYGGGTTDFRAANVAFRKCIEGLGKWCVLCKLVAWWRFRGVERFGRDAFNWRGPGLPK